MKPLLWSFLLAMAINLSCSEVEERLNSGESQSPSIAVTTDGWFPVLEFENEVYRAVTRSHDGAVCGVEHAIRDWIVKSVDQDRSTITSTPAPSAVR